MKAQAFAIPIPLVKAAGSGDRWIIEGEASTEGLDVDGDVVLAKAVEKEIKSYLRRGTLRWQHNPANVPLGRVLDLQIKNGRTWFKAELSKASAKAREIWEQLKEGLVYYGASLGGKILNVVQKFSDRLQKMVTYITDIRLDETSITDNPANRDTWVRASSLQKAAEKFVHEAEDIPVYVGSRRYTLRQAPDGRMTLWVPGVA